MMFIYFIILEMLPSVFSNWCHFNHSSLALRKSVSLEFSKHQYVHLYDVDLQITSNNDIDINRETSCEYGTQLALLDEISFKGYFLKNDESTYLNVKLKNLKSYRWTQNENGNCIIAFQESEKKSVDLTTDQKRVIMDLTESCIKAALCGMDLNEIDKDANLRYQSTQAAINAVVDFYVPKVLDLFLDENKFFKIKSINKTVGGFHFYQKTGYLIGLPSIHRTKDVFIEREGSKFVIELGMRATDINITLEDAAVGWKFFSIHGHITARAKKLSFSSKLVVDWQASSCSLALKDFNFIAFEKIQVKMPLWNLFPVTINLKPKNIGRFWKMFMAYVAEWVSNISVDCQEYADQLFDMLK
ncbi:uncharacterized protein LOC107980928 isoform X2 [Nasonia vitripennis]|uniref:Uncharacterized protein n=1 Tax=Nasonia vitripennis TaxID=7425 RepID=A0A7M7IPY4_NASVI|nr:uncharacterized protein LOC107980928 isoform X2 [Nasonia vitripennis]XP_016839746.1 uncharacterized protein LOC107980928 isoform X2 [Nasonia vitripennis]